MYKYIYICRVFTKEDMIKGMLLIQICLISYLISSSSSFYILYIAVSNSSPITLQHIFISFEHNDV